jgi:hypothetical protein
MGKLLTKNKYLKNYFSKKDLKKKEKRKTIERYEKDMKKT